MYVYFLFKGSECRTFSELCPGPHRASVRALANGITTEKVQNFEIPAYGTYICVCAMTVLYVFLASVYRL